MCTISNVSLPEEQIMSQQWNGYDLPLNLSVKVNYVEEVDNGCKPSFPVRERQLEWEDSLQALDLRIHRNKNTTNSSYTIYNDTAPAYSYTAPAYSDTTPAYSDTTPAYSDTAPAYSDTASTYSYTTLIYSDTTPTYSNTRLIYSDTTPTYSNTRLTYSDTTPTYSNTRQTYSDTTPTYSNTRQTYSDTSITCSDTTPTGNTYWQLEDQRNLSLLDNNLDAAKEDKALLDSSRTSPTPDVVTHFLNSNRQQPNEGQETALTLAKGEGRAKGQGESMTPELPTEQTVTFKEYSGPMNPYTCQVCSKSYRQVRDYRAHVATHEDAKMYTCDICFSQLSTPSQYLQHLQGHKQKQLYVCVYCKKYFRDRCTLSTHMRTHTGEKPYQCDVCGKRFRQSGTFLRHKKIHEFRT